MLTFNKLRKKRNCSETNIHLRRRWSSSGCGYKLTLNMVTVSSPNRLRVTRLAGIAHLSARPFTLNVVVSFPARHPLSSLKSPVIRVRQHNLHKHIVVGRRVQGRDIETQEGKHAPAKIESNKNK